MKQIAIQLTAQSPLSIRADHAPGGAATAPYIPGTAFIGSLAAVYRLYHPGQKDKFEKLFLRERVHYPDLYPANFKPDALEKKEPAEKRGLQEKGYLPVYPAPKTAQSCKRHPGFRFPESEENDDHGVRDSLIDWALFRLGVEHGSSNALNTLTKHKECQYPKCKAAMSRFSGYYRRNDEKESGKAFYAMEKALEVEYTRLQTHTGIDRVSGTVQDGILYNRVVFEEGTRFWGAIHVSDETTDDAKLLSELRGFLKEVGNQGLVRIGTGRTRGMGIVNIQISEKERQGSSYADFEARLDAFDQLVREQADKELGVHDPRYFFALTLHSPLILCDEFLRYRSTIDKQTLLEDLLGWKEGIELKQIYQAASVRRMTGWQEIWGTPRMKEYAIDTGSVFLFACNFAEKKSEKDTLLHKLFELEQQGAGARRVEGFGRVCVSDQFHQEREMR